MRSKPLRKYTIPPAPKVPTPLNEGDMDERVQSLHASFNELKRSYTMLDKEVRIQREVYIQALTMLGCDPTRIRDLDRKIRRELSSGK